MRKKIKTLKVIIKEHGFLSILLFLKYRLIQALLRFIGSSIRFDSRHDPVRSQIDTFFEEVNGLDRPRILELGSRNISHKNMFNSYSEYVGFDINAGPHVDKVGDAHRLSDYFPPAHFDVVYAIAVFEHLAMPWKVVQEINKVLKEGGLLFIFTHHTFPLHAEPWDFWRFSKSAFSTLLNAQTGFEIIDSALGWPCLILPLENAVSLKETHKHLSFMGITVLAKKKGDSDSSLNWKIEMKNTVEDSYPMNYLKEGKLDVFFEYLKDRKKTNKLKE